VNRKLTMVRQELLKVRIARPYSSDVNSVITSLISQTMTPKQERNCASVLEPIASTSDTASETSRKCSKSPSNMSEPINQDADFSSEDIFLVDITQSKESNIRLPWLLKEWMPQYQMKSLPPQPYPPREPLYSARLGDKLRIKRCESTESVNTVLSLFSCSDHDQNISQPNRKFRKKKQNTLIECKTKDGEESIWVKLASKHRSTLDRLVQMNAAHHQYFDSETEIFKCLPEEERVMVTKAGYTRGTNLGPRRQRSDSLSNIQKHDLKAIVKKRLRAKSLGGSHDGPMLNFIELHRQLINQKIEAMQQKHSRRHRSSRRSSLSQSRQSLASFGSPFTSMNNTPRNLSPVDTLFDHEEHVTMWKGDSQILAIDLRRELTAKVKEKITVTTIALERVTGLGDDNELRIFTGALEEYPNLVEEDYSHIAKIPQRIRISPHLSQVIKSDIHARMGRPRYHEIREKDLSHWNKGQYLDRAHRNLKVFNWLHSLKESEFDLRRPESVHDRLSDKGINNRDEMVISVDEPKIRPLFERLKQTRYIL